MASLVKILSVKGFGIVNDCTDTYLILNTQSCGLLLEPRLDLMAPETVCLIMQTLYKSTLNEAFIIRQIDTTTAITICLIMNASFNVLL